MNQYFAVCAPGLEEILTAEMAQLDLSPTPEKGGVAFCGDRRDLYRANLHLRTASRVLLRLDEFYAGGFPELKRKIGRIDWATYLTPGQPVTLRVSCAKSRLYHSGAVAERVLEALGRQLKKMPPVRAADEEDGDGSAQRILIRLFRDRCTVSLDSSGAHLHRRGYRLATAKAPLRETFAAAMLRSCGYDGSAPLIDPFCGAGTIPIEAALLARRIPPGWQRQFAFQHWPDFDAGLWQRLREAAAAGFRPAPAPISGSDRDAGAIAAAAANAGRAGVGGDITFTEQPFSVITPPGPFPGASAGPGWIITNLPYGVRVRGNRDLRNLYAGLGEVLRDQFSGWQVGLLGAEERLLAQTRLDYRPLLRFRNGSVPVCYVAATVTASPP